MNEKLMSYSNLKLIAQTNNACIDSKLKLKAPTPAHEIAP